MVADHHRTTESHITTDPQQIETWARETDAVPVREGGQLRMVEEGRFDDARHDRIDWDDFEREIADSDRVVVYQEERDTLEVRHRSDAMTHLEGEDVEDRLLEGEVVSGTITETAVVERTIVEEAEIESEVVDRTVVDRQVVDAELISRECTSCDLEERGSPGAGDGYDADYFLGKSEDGGVAGTEDLTFELEVDEAWSLTLEELEEVVVESRVADVDVAGSDAVEDVDLETDLEMAGLHRQLLRSNLFTVDVHEMDEADVEDYAIESEIHEGDAVRTTLSQHRTVDREVAMAHRVTATGTESHRTNVQTAHEEVVESGLAEPGQGTLGASGTDTAAETETTTGGSLDRTHPTADDEGKTVVGVTGEEVGVVTGVENGVAYVDPHPSMTEKVMARLGWGDADEEAYAVDPDQVAEITDDRIVLEHTE